MSRLPVAALSLTVFLSVLLTTSLGCASNEGTGGGSLATRGLCYWDDVRWDDRAILRFPEGQPLGRARARWSGSTWTGAHVSGVLRPRDGHIAFEGRWTAGGFTVEGMVDVANEAVFSVWDPTRFGAGAMMRGAHVTVLDARVGSALVLPSVAALNSFVPEAAPAVELSCESLAIRPRQSATDETSLLLKAGLAPLSEASFTGEDVVAAWERPGKDFVGAFLPGARVWLLARQGEWARVATVSDGVVWVGWVAQARLDAAPKPKPAPPAETGNVVGAEKLAWRSCDEPLNILIRGPEGAHTTATLASRTPFALRKREPEHDPDFEPVIVGPTWLEFARGVELLVPSSASRCSSVVGPW
ncbi:MAG: hypothetical protein U0228_26005 [Myxococcaceae bacterium]